MASEPKAFRPTLAKNMSRAFVTTLIEVASSRPRLLMAIGGAILGAVIFAALLLYWFRREQ